MAVLAGALVFASCGPSAAEVVAPVSQKVAQLEAQVAALTTTVSGINEWGNSVNDELVRLYDEIAEVSEASPPSVVVMPNVGPGRYKPDIYGANFEPGQTLTASTLVTRFEGGMPIETYVGPDGVATPFQADDLGSFHLTGSRLARDPGVYPLVVRDEAGNILASTVFIIE
jgi:hypothetical protein